MNKIIHTDLAPAAIGPYSQAVQTGGLLFVSGQLPIDPATGAFAGDDITAQTRQSLTNMKNILLQAGADMCDVVKTTVLLADIADFAAMNAVYAEVFEGTLYPTRTTLEAARLPKDSLVVMDAIAAIPD